MKQTRLALASRNKRLLLVALFFSIIGYVIWSVFYVFLFPLSLPPASLYSPLFIEPKFDKDVRILCMIPTQIHSRSKFVTILDTWGKWCDGLYFMVDPPEYCEEGKESSQPEETTETIFSTDRTVSGTIVFLNKLVRKKGNLCYAGGHGTTKCRHIWEKVWRSWVYIADHMAHKYDFFFKVDDDTFFFVPTMREVILERQWRSTDHHYFGQRSFVVNKDHGLINGALVGLSRLTLVTLVEVKYKHLIHEYGDRSKFQRHRCVDRDGATEEVTTSICLLEIGVEPEGLYDSLILPRRPHVLLWMARDLLTFSRRDNSSSWMYKNAPRDVGTLLDCCSYRPVAFHFMRLNSDMLRVYDLIVDPLDKKELEHVIKDKVPQWEKSATPDRPLSCSVFDHVPFIPATCAAEAKYWELVKRVWKSRDPVRYRVRLL